MSGENVVMSEHDFALIEDTHRRATDKNPIIACAGLHRVRAFYGSSSVQLFFGKPELIATDPDYRGRGLVSQLIRQLVHPESEARGDTLQFIIGLPNFYRQYGYEYAISRYNPGKILNVDKIPKREQQQEEPYRLRRANRVDIPFLLRMSTKERVDPFAELGVVYGPEYWHYTVEVNTLENAKDRRFDGDRDTQIVVDARTGEDVGFTIVSHMKGLKLEALSLLEGKVFVADALYPILRGLIKNEKQRLEQKKVEETDPLVAENIKATGFPMAVGLPPMHPVCQLLKPVMEAPDTAPGYRLFARIADYVPFIRIVQPELETRLARSPMAGTTGRLQLDFYRLVEGNNARGLEIVFEKGKILEVQHWSPPSEERKVEEFLKHQKAGTIKPRIFEAAFAPLTFTTLALGDRNLEELQFSYGENTCANEKTRMLLNILFPKVLHHMDTGFW